MSKHPLYNETGLLKNNKPHVLYALANKQMELKELQREYEARIAQIKLDLTGLIHLMNLNKKPIFCTFSI